VWPGTSDQKRSGKRAGWLHQPDLFVTHLITSPLTYRSDSPAWKRLLSKTLTTPERVSLITAIFSDHDQVEIYRHLSRTDAQTFIDMMDEVIICTK